MLAASCTILLMETVPTTPLRPILAELTHEVNETGEDPFEAYVRLCAGLGKRGLWFDTYLSSSITSGGHARDNSLSMLEVITRNTDTALDIADELYRYDQLDPERSIEAVTLGKIKHWQQSDYMTFWLSVMSRFEFESPGATTEIEMFRRRFEQQLEITEVDMDAYNSGILTSAERAPQYIKHADTFASVARSVDSFSPIPTLVQLSDTDTSLGSQTERYFAKVNDTRVKRPAVAQLGAVNLPEAYPSPRLVRDVATIVKFGGHVFDTVQRTQLVLVDRIS